ncbi:GDSL esterase/lipase At1g29660 [Aspergillus udagawae]|nr:GDSL esterase/lipase At1g29660 [Aspergillus udagawae]GFG16117.1 GDSL esterase/lipase At1g29660 [Aspergillus udagawae]
MVQKSIFSGLFLFSGLSAGAPVSASVAGALPANTKYLITFGDSYSQTGFNISGSYPSATNPLGNPELPGQTTSGGLNWIGFLASQYNTSLILSFNFAYGGATTNASIVAPWSPSVLSLIDQVNLFSNSIASKPPSAPWNSHNTLAGIWMGINDIGGSYARPDLEMVLIEVMKSYFGQLQILYNAGIRNFMLLTVPPMQKTPLMIERGSEVVAQETAAVEKYNSLLATYLSKFLSSNTQSRAKLIHTRRPFDTAINNPTAYGAPNATCVNWDGTSCLWRDPYHPGVAIQNLTAQHVLTELEGWFLRRDH